MSKTQSNQILSVFLPRGWEQLKIALKQAAKAQADPELRNVSGLVRAILAKGLVFAPGKTSPSQQSPNETCL